MSDIGLIMDGLLGLLLVGALLMGWRLDGRLKALRASHQSFTRAVEDLDRAAARAEQGLADLRAATDEAAESLAGRIERAGHLAVRLERLTGEAAVAEAKLTIAPRPAAAPGAAAPRESALQRFAERYSSGQGKTAQAAALLQPSSPFADAAARNDLILEDDGEPAATPLRPARPDVSARMERLRAMVRPANEAPKPRARIDDELFEAPRVAAGGAR